jgi:hypothetical protein
MHGFLQEQRNTEAMTDRRDVKAQGSAVLSQQLNVQEEMRTRHLRKFRCTGGGMR